MLLTHGPAIIPEYLSRGAENLRPHKNLHTGVYGSFIHNYPNLEAPSMSFSRWMDKLWYPQTMAIHSKLKRNELLSHERHGGILNIWLGERHPSEKAAHCVTPAVWHSGKGRTMETITRSGVAWGWGWADEQAEHRGFLGQWKYSGIMMMDTCHCTLICPNP